MTEKEGIEYKFTLRDGTERYEVINRQCEIGAFMKMYNAIKAEKVIPVSPGAQDQSTAS